MHHDELDAHRPLVMIGDSITDADRDRDADRDADGLGDGWVRLAADALAAAGDSRRVINRGISGNRVCDLRSRWQRDVIELNPAVLTVLIGVNEAWRRYEDGIPTSVAEFEDDYRSVLVAAQDACSPRLILMEPFLTPTDASRQGWREDLDPRRVIVAALADEFGAQFVPLDTLMNQTPGGVGGDDLAPDSVHPSPAGARVIADAWLAAFRRL